MRNIFLLLLVPFLYLSCSNEPETEDVTLELLPVSEVELPVNFTINKDNIIKVHFIRPSECYAFNQFYYEMNGSVSTFAVESKVSHSKNGGCPPLQSNNILSQNLKFRPEQTGQYTLKFWNGKDTNGNDLFLIYTILIEQ